MPIMAIFGRALEFVTLRDPIGLVSGRAADAFTRVVGDRVGEGVRKVGVQVSGSGHNTVEARLAACVVTTSGSLVASFPGRPASRN